MAPRFLVNVISFAAQINSLVQISQWQGDRIGFFRVGASHKTSDDIGIQRTCLQYQQRCYISQWKSGITRTYKGKFRELPVLAGSDRHYSDNNHHH